MKTKTISGLKPVNIIGMIILLVIISLSVNAGPSPNSFYEGTIKLNPDCKIKRLSNGGVIVFTKNLEGIIEKQEFTDFYADLLIAAYRKQRIEYILNTFAKKYYLSQEDCRREIKHAINVLTEWNIVLHEDTMAAR